MINIGEAPSNQLELTLEGINDVSRARWDEAHTWKCRHYDEWCWYKDNARTEGRLNPHGASPNTCLSDMRRHFRVSLPNAWAPALARMAKAENPSINFNMKKSMFDACSEVPL